MLTAIPDWNSQGVVSPVDPHDPTSPNRSPYVVSLVEFVRKFSITPERIGILRGFLEYRAALHTIELTEGFQWLDGSFLEHKERRLAKPPGDIDVVTFFQLPPSTSESELVERDFSLFDPAQHENLKIRFGVDSNFQPLYVPVERLVKGSNYWYGLWSHQRETLIWKGFCQVPLAPSEDALARDFLSNLPGGVTP